MGLECVFLLEALVPDVGGSQSGSEYIVLRCWCCEGLVGAKVKE